MWEETKGGRLVTLYIMPQPFGFLPRFRSSSSSRSSSLASSFLLSSVERSRLLFCVLCGCFSPLETWRQRAFSWPPPLLRLCWEVEAWAWKLLAEEDRLNKSSGSGFVFWVFFSFLADKKLGFRVSKWRFGGKWAECYINSWFVFFFSGFGESVRGKRRWEDYDFQR